MSFNFCNSLLKLLLSTPFEAKGVKLNTFSRVTHLRRVRWEQSSNPDQTDYSDFSMYCPRGRKPVHIEEMPLLAPPLHIIAEDPKVLCCDQMLWPLQKRPSAPNTTCIGSAAMSKWKGSSHLTRKASQESRKGCVGNQKAIPEKEKERKKENHNSSQNVNGNKHFF